ncbi:IclR family transcriptional regulator [Actinoplanes sp. URMC 104]|uniref:IclR family transcriptional regulator n=1 Tax=Actinoplanes sp. URMC 104 TaxID=3423409 RepID=UPI003F1A2DFE
MVGEKVPSAGDAAAKDAGVREVKSAARTVDVLELMASRGNEPVRLRELSDALGAPRSSVYALLRTLVERGWVRTDASGTLYSIGIRALLAGTTYLDFDPLLRIVQPHVNELSVKLDETIHYGRLHGADIVYLATHESSQYLRPFSRVGRRLPAYSTALGKALLAERLDVEGDDSVVAHLPSTLAPLTPHTLTDAEALTTDLKAVRERGYSIDRQENLLGVVCFGVALRVASVPVDAISCSVPVERLRGDREAQVVEELCRTKYAIERLTPPPPSGSRAWE